MVKLTNKDAAKVVITLRSYLGIATSIEVNLANGDELLSTQTMLDIARIADELDGQI